MNIEIINEICNNIESNKPFYKEKAFETFFSWKDLELLINLRPFLNSDRFHFLNLHNKNIEWPNQAWLSDVNTFPASVIRELAENGLMYISDCSRVNENINYLCKKIEEATDMCCDAHIYFNLLDYYKNGFPIHWDYSHNLIIQFEGKSIFKVWDLCSNNTQQRSIEEEDIKKEPLINIEMNTGDAIFVPMYTYHQVIPQSKRISISFPFSKNELKCQDREWIKI